MFYFIQQEFSSKLKDQRTFSFCQEKHERSDMAKIVDASKSDLIVRVFFFLNEFNLFN